MRQRQGQELAGESQAQQTAEAKGSKCVKERMTPALSWGRLHEASEKVFSAENAEMRLKNRKEDKISAEITCWLLTEGRQMGQQELQREGQKVFQNQM